MLFKIPQIIFFYFHLFHSRKICSLASMCKATVYLRMELVREVNEYALVLYKESRAQNKPLAKTLQSTNPSLHIPTQPLLRLHQLRLLPEHREIC